MAGSLITPANLATSAAAVIGVGIFIWLYVRFVVKPIWRGRATSGDTLTQWVLPALFVIGGLIAEIVAAYGAVTGTTWRS